MDIYQEISAIKAQLDRMEQRLNEERGDKMLTFEQAAKFLGISESRLYKLTSARAIPCYKMPGGKRLYFFQSELEAFIRNGRLKTAEEIEQQADTYLSTRNGK